MGSNRRYPSILEKEIERGVVRQTAPVPSALTLSEEELEKKNQTLRRLQNPVAVRVWVHFSDGSVAHIETARAVAHTVKAVFVEAEHQGHRFGTWVWANAVERIHPRQLGET